MRPFSLTLRATASVATLLTLLPCPVLAAEPPPVPDLTQGGTKDDKHDWTLGPTGARGWMWGWKLETTEARQILVTEITPGTPADGVLEVGDVILGVGDTPFTDDPRKVFGAAITEAETERSGGKLQLLRWRKGKQESVELTLPVLGSYSDTAPADCPKTAKLVDAGLRHLATHMKGGIDGKVNALALLASGEERYVRLVRDYVHELAPPDLKLRLHSDSGMVAWHWGYTNLLLTEYYLATGDDYVLPAIREHAVNLAKGQSVVGTWGHGMAWPDLNGGKLHGRLGGYGAMNQAGLICLLSLILSEKCGVHDPEITRALDLGNRFFDFYIGKGAIPYGDHRPGWHVHDDNGKCSSAAIMFDVQGHAAGTRFFTRMTVASYGERERGHTGNYFSFLWGPLGAARAGRAALAAFLKEQRWFYDLARRPDGSYRYQGGAGMSGSENKYGGWDCTGQVMLAYLTPRKKLFITGKGTHPENALTGAELAEVLECGRGFNSRDMGIEPYRQKTDTQLLACLRSWSPAVRYRASVALSEREGDYVPRLLELLEVPDLNTQYGACQALGSLRQRAAAAVPALIQRLEAEDVWLRIQAAYALAGIGPPARAAINPMLKLALRSDPKDPREFTQRYLCFCLFYPGGALKMQGLAAKSLDGVDRELLYPAVKRLLLNDDGRARGCVGSVYDLLSYEELKPLLPAIHKSILEPSPSGVMFASGIRMQGLDLFARLRIKEGIPLCLQVMEIDKWGKRARINSCLKTLQSYGGAAKSAIPQLRQLEQQLQAHREAKGLTEQIELVRSTIAKIQAAPDGPPLRSLHDK